VLLALLEDRPLETVPERSSRRFQIHFALGITY